MISFSEARRKVLEKAGEAGVEEVSLADSGNRILREDLVADRPSPPFNRVAMDGIAVFLGKTFITKGRWKIAGVIQAGQQGWNINSGECFEIMTGASLPDCTNTIIKVEDLEIKEGFATLQEGVVVHSGQNIHFRGSDIAEGQKIIKKYSRITPGVRAIAASMGYDKIQVSKRPTVGIISTGNELVGINEQPLPFQIRRSNDIMVGGILREYAAEIRYYTVKDCFENTKQMIKKCQEENEICITIGGISKGKFDFIPEILQALNADIFITTVRQKPGKPFIFARNPSGFIFALPGNPTSAFVCSYVYILPFLRRHSGDTTSTLRKIRLSEMYENKSKMTRIVEMRLVQDGDQARPIETNGSGDMTGLAQAEVIGIFAPSATYPAGSLVDIIKVN